MIFFPWFLASQRLSWFASGLYGVIVLEFYRLSWETWAGKLRNLYVRSTYPDVKDHGDMLGIDYCHLPWVFRLRRLSCRADPRNTVRNDLFWSGIQPQSGQLSPATHNSFCVWQPGLTRFHKQYGVQQVWCLLPLPQPQWSCGVQSTEHAYYFPVRTGLLLTVTDYGILCTTIKFCGQCNIHPSPLVLRKVRWKLTWSKSLVKTSTTFGLHAVAHRWSANNHLKARFPLFPSWILEKKLLIHMSFFPSSIPTGINIVILVGPSNVRGWKFRDRKQNTTSPLDLLFEPVSHRGTMYSVLRRHQILQSSDDRRQGTVGAEVSGPARWRCSGVVMLYPHWVMFASALVVVWSTYSVVCHSFTNSLVGTEY